MKKLIFALFALTTTAFAVIRPDPGQFALGVEYLCWHPLFDQSAFVLRDTTPVTLNTPSGERLVNPTHWNSGFRLEAIYESCNCCNDFDLRYTRFHVSNRQTYTSPTSNLVPTRGHVAFTNSFNTMAQSDLRFDLDVVEGLFWTVPFNCGCEARLKGGLNYSNIYFKETIVYSGPPTDTSPRFGQLINRAKFWGLGPEIELDVYYPLNCILPFVCPLPVCFHGDVRGSLLVGKSRASYNEFNLQPAPNVIVPIDVQTDAIWRFVPIWDIRFGLSSQFKCCCVMACLEVGYEFLTYRNSLQTTIFYTGTNGTNTLNTADSFDTFGNLDFHGPYVAFGLSF